MPAFDRYLGDIRNGTGYFATWVPNTPMELGLYGTLKDGVFTRFGSLRDRVEVIKGLPGAMSRSCVKDSHGALGASADVPVAQALGKAGAKLALGFGSQGDFVFHAVETVPHVIGNLQDLADYMVTQEVLRAWDAAWYFVHEVVESGPFVTVVSTSDTSQVDFKLKAETAAADLGNIDFSAGATVSKGEALAYVMMKGQPLFKLCRLKKRFWGKPGLKAVASGATAEALLDEAPAGSVNLIDLAHAKK